MVDSVFPYVKGRRRGVPVRLTPNEPYNAAWLADSYWLYVVWDPLSNPARGNS